MATFTFSFTSYTSSMPYVQKYFDIVAWSKMKTSWYSQQTRYMMMMALVLMMSRMSALGPPSFTKKS